MSAIPGPITLTGIVRQFGDAQARPVLNGIDLTLAPGTLLALVGPSGAGKTTLLRILAGLDRGYAGRITWPGGVAPSIGMVFQEARLVPWLKLLDNLLLVRPDDATAEAKSAVRDLLAAVELDGMEAALPSALSGGMQRRAALARALLAQPDLLLLDEPFVSLDRASAARLRAVLIRHWQRYCPTVVLVTHDLGEAAELADRVAVLSPETGRISDDRALGLPHPRDPQDPAVAALAGALKAMARDWPQPDRPEATPYGQSAGR
jgi:ABC-type nitrate/sulfonate/bicarbonate transport system ATPase subunit